MEKRKGQVRPRFFIYITGLLVMSLGIVLLIKSDLGATPWDVLHIGLYHQLGLTIGSWSVLAGLFILTVAAILAKEIPQIGAFLNMILVGAFIDMYLWMSFLDTPSSTAGKTAMFAIGILLQGYGMGLYISAQFGAGPRDSLMIAISSRTGWQIRNVRALIEVIVLLAGWRLGGPVFWGTIFFSIFIGPIAGKALPQCQSITDKFLKAINRKRGIELGNSGEEKNRGALL
ncbi:YczE/YyaS/YitT family protein [Bacillus sp. T33-2]|uniref:YczE/YyaS/YitT family protein n=1 Tax=Bacillus sp. T33-2 TaxID=2054168 RepID=UPI000C75E3A7|nr:YitT family protein [Bacillus sp. T33-2]PLR93757.1 hypothetical protein CVD19_18695 [Bacillus sp. T33-2]